MVMKGVVNFIKTVFIGAGTSKRDGGLHTINVGGTTGWSAANHC